MINFYKYATNHFSVGSYCVEDKEDINISKKVLSIKIDYLSVVLDILKDDELIRRLLGLPLEYFLTKVNHKNYTRL